MRKAYQYRPDNGAYAFQYGITLHKQKSYTLAQPVYESALQTYRQLAAKTPEVYEPYVAPTLVNLGIIYYHMHASATVRSTCRKR